MFAALEHAPRHVDNDASLAAGPSSVSANPAGASARRRERMSTQAGRYLNDFAAVHGLSPTREQMETLLAGVKAMPGHDYYQMNHLKHWFYARRGRKHGGIAPVAPPVSLPPSTTLTAKQTSDLQKLIERTAVIDDALLDLWASLFSVQKTVIEAWLRDNAALPPTPVTPSQPAWIPGNLAEAAARAGQSVEQWRNSLSHEPAQHRLPTPAETVSPGPDSPLLTHSQIKRPLSRNATSHLPVTMQAVSSPIVPTHSPVNLHASDPIRTAIIQGIKEGSSAPTNRHAKTAAEFNELWNRFEPKLTRVAQALDSSTRP